MTEDLAKYEARQPVVMPPADKSLLELVIAKGADLQTIEKFMDLQERHEANEARKAYVVAMTNFKASPPEILKQTAVSYDTSKGTTSYNHASLDHVAEKINIALSGHGLFASWSQNQADKGITVTCKITHILGHSEETSLTAGADLSGNKNAIQGLGSTISYLQRYTILAITGLAAKGMDTDGKLPEGEEPPEAITQKQIEDIEKLKGMAKIDTPEKELKFKNRLQELYKTPAIDRLDTEQAKDLKKSMKEGIEFQAKKKKGESQCLK